MIGHLKQHSFTGSTDHDYTGLNGGEVLIFDGTNVISTNSNNLGTGTGNYVPKWNSNGSGLTDSNLIDDGTTVQTLLPLEFGTFASSISANTFGQIILTPRQVPGANRIGVNISSPNNSIVHIKQTDSAVGQGAQLFLDGGGFGAQYESTLLFGYGGLVRGMLGLDTSNGKIHLKRSVGLNHLSGTSNVTYMTWMNSTSNRVGIGNESPVASLDVTNNSVGVLPTVIFRGSRADSAGDTLRLLSSAGTINAVFEDGGDVGIGTSAPSATVDIVGDFELNGDFSGGTGGGVIYSGGTDLYNIFSTGGGGISTYEESLASPAIGTNTVTHNLGTTDITVQLWLEGTGDMITTKITNRTANSVDIVWSSAPGENIRVVVQG